MSEATMKVPAEHATDVRLAALAELDEAGEWVASNAEEQSRHLVEGRELALTDAHGSTGYLSEILAILDQLADGSRQLRGDAGTLGHVGEALVRKVLEPRLASEAAVSPLDAEAARKIEAVSASVRWATGEAARLHGLDQAERDAVKATG